MRQSIPEKVTVISLPLTEYEVFEYNDKNLIDVIKQKFKANESKCNTRVFLKTTLRTWCLSIKNTRGSSISWA